MLRGSALANLDDKGRLKIPSAFRSVNDPKYGKEFFVSSLRGGSVRIYPLQVFADVEQRLLVSSGVDPAIMGTGPPQPIRTRSSPGPPGISRAPTTCLRTSISPARLRAE